MLTPLPNTFGPRMPHFNEALDHDHELCIEWLEVIGSGLHAHVVKAKINGLEYAVKIVCHLSHFFGLTGTDIL